jgi:hypothetical protein
MRKHPHSIQGIRTAAQCLLLSFLIAPALADPCGMVPPIQLSGGTPELMRVGNQLTYVFFKDGVEDIALRPGFKGKLTDFGMLIPFPTPPDIRKVPDAIFQHIEKAIDPPEIVIDMRPRRAMKMLRSASVMDMSKQDDSLMLGSVTVLKEEAVGMYQVAVLAATDPRALQLWMTTHGYVYPTGMDDVCKEYIEADWCFVAVKANVGSQAAVEPKPGMRKADANVPGAEFEGAVQAMGFRFRVKEPVVPMRLSAFNEGELFNIVYFFSDQAVRIKQLPEKFVKGRIAGERLYKNMTDPLPVKVLGGTIEQAEKAGYFKMPQYNRDPAPHNAHALDLFSSDLLALRTGELTHPFEAREKELLLLGERLGLRGENVDELIGEVIDEEREKAFGAIEADFAGMTLTVIEGDFPRDIIARHNLTFEKFAAKNLPANQENRKQSSWFKRMIKRLSSIAGQMSAVLALTCVAGVVLRQKRLFLVLALLGMSTAAMAREVGDIRELMSALSAPDSSQDAAAKIIAMGDPAVHHLIGEAVEGTDYNRRGWAIVCLADIGSKAAVKPLQLIVDDKSAPNLVKMWAGAALMRIRGAEAIKDLLRQEAADSSKREAVAALLLGMRSSVVRPLTELALRGETNEDRRRATAWLGTLEQRLQGGIVRRVLASELAYSKERASEGVPWEGGALYLPRYAWPQPEAISMSRNLTCWLLSAEDAGKKDVARQLLNNLRDLSWRTGMGFQQQSSGYDWTVKLIGQAGFDANAVTKGTEKQALILILQLMERDGGQNE